MAYTYPVSLADFFGTLPIQTASPDLGEAYEHSETGAGEIISADLGTRLWKMDIGIRTGSYDEIEPVKAKLNILRRAGASLIVHAIPRKAPRHDPTGALLGSSTPVLASVNANNRELTISGLPAGYKLATGDCFSFTYGSNPVRYAMHQIVRDATANGSGVISLEISDFIRPGFAIGAAITLIKPCFKAVVVPGSTTPGQVGGQVIEGVGFSVIQTLR